MSAGWLDDLADLDAEDLSCLGLRRVSDDDWSVFSAAERRERDVEYVRAMGAQKRRERREEQAREIAVIKAAQKAGLSVKRAVIGGVTVEFGQPEAAAPTATLTPLEAWKAKHARQA